MNTRFPGRFISRRARAAALALGPFLFPLSACDRAPAGPEKPRLEMTLELARPRWRVGESPWYRVRMKNVGSRPVCLEGKEREGIGPDGFWTQQRAHAYTFRHELGTRIEVHGPDGKKLLPGFFKGFHGEFHIWTDDESQAHVNAPPNLVARSIDYLRAALRRPHHVFGYIGDEWFKLGHLERRLARPTQHCAIELMPGQTITTTPSIPAPYRPSGEFVGLADARIPPNASKEERRAYERLWMLQSQLSGGGADPYEPQRPIPGYRILDEYGFRKPGRYRIKAVYNTFQLNCPISSEEEMEIFYPRQRGNFARPDDEAKRWILKKWASKSPAELERHQECRRRDEEFNRAKGVRVESNTFEIEVIR